MHPLSLLAPRSGGLRLLAIGAHADDIELGAGATLLTLLDAGAVSRLDWLVLSAVGERADEAANSAAQRVAGIDGSVQIGALPESHFHTVHRELKAAVAAMVRRSEPDVVLCPALHDVHQDHRATAEAVQQACRNHLVLQYEIVKYEGDLRTPNVYVPFDEPTMAAKVAWLQDAFPSQHDRQWWDPEMFRGLARIRGVESVARYAEGFHCRKLVVGCDQEGANR